MRSCEQKIVSLFRHLSRLKTQIWSTACPQKKCFGSVSCFLMMVSCYLNLVISTFSAVLCICCATFEHLHLRVRRFRSRLGPELFASWFTID